MCQRITNQRWNRHHGELLLTRGGRRVPLAMLLLVLSGLLVGCSKGQSNSAGGGGGGGASGATGGTASAAAAKAYAANQLPPVSLDLPPLDSGRIEVPTPDKWAPLSQKKEYVVAFQIKGRTGFPQIVVTAEDVEQPDVTKDNVTQYAADLQRTLDAQVTAKKLALLEPAKPLVLGRNAYARYVVKGRKQGKDVATLERQLLRTVRGGRQYTIDLTVTDDLTAHRDHAYAVAAGIKFVASDEAPAPRATAGETPAVDGESSKKDE